MRILVVDDEPHLVASLRKGLEAEGFTVDTCGEGKEAVYRATVDDYDGIVLDMMLPGLSGAEVVERLRTRGRDTPILMLTAVSDDERQAQALDLGADDYLTKPFSFVVLLAHLRALLRRSSAEPPVQLTSGSLTIDLRSHAVQRRGREVRLTPREFELLVYLMRNGGAVVSKRELLDEVWEGDTDSPANVVEVYIGYLRRKIDAPFGTHSLATVRGFGYRLDPED